MITRKVKELRSLGKLMFFSKVDLDTNKNNIGQNKRIEARKKIELTNIQANVSIFESGEYTYGF